MPGIQLRVQQRHTIEQWSSSRFDQFPTDCRIRRIPHPKRTARFLPVLLLSNRRIDQRFPKTEHQRVVSILPMVVHLKSDTRRIHRKTQPRRKMQQQRQLGAKCRLFWHGLANCMHFWVFVGVLLMLFGDCLYSLLYYCRVWRCRSSCCRSDRIVACGSYEIVSMSGCWDCNTNNLGPEVKARIIMTAQLVLRRFVTASCTIGDQSPLNESTINKQGASSTDISMDRVLAISDFSFGSPIT